MRRYTAEDEERIRAQAHVRAWARAGLLAADQAAALDVRLRTDLRRTNVFLRAVLALFTAVIVAASVGLVFVWSGFDRTQAATAATFAGAAVVCAALAEYLVAAFRLYRYGVEEMLAVAAAVLLALSADQAAHALRLSHAHAIMAAVAAGASLAAYRRLGLLYAAVGALAAATLVPFGLGMSEAAQHAIAAAICAVVFAWMRALHARHGDDFPGDEYAALGAAAYAGVYLTLNLRVFELFNPFDALALAQVDRRFYWATYAATWQLPAVALALSIREKDRLLLTVAIGSALATLSTNKPYLGWPRQTWDPILLGLLLIAIATAVRRWLGSGPAGARGGFTAEKILERDRDALSAIATASAAWPHQHDHQAHRPEPPPSQFEGGRSGGGGGGAAY